MVEGPGARRPGRGGGGVGAWRPRDAALPERGAAGDPPRAAGGGGSGPRLGAPDASRRGAGRGRGGARGQVEALQETGRPSSPHSEPASWQKVYLKERPVLEDQRALGVEECLEGRRGQWLFYLFLLHLALAFCGEL
ncbi:translation initiation factor IF-2-like [Acinonyx jubatus]|uniref:Translation initiation factor IF-2-like n=1 Tax=Acinonyx jubatus TaxID=32536 RepID=A0ABM3PKM3_ACIJB|nr:translation initiation factor IF-2-like [Acinonyx jubatus]